MDGPAYPRLLTRPVLLTGSAVWLAALLLDIARVLGWQNATAGAPDTALVVGVKLLAFVPWLLYGLALLWVAQRRRWLAEVSALSAAVHLAAALALMIVHALLVAAGLIVLDFPGARAAPFAQLLQDVWFNFAQRDMMAALLVYVGLCAVHHVQRVREAAHPQLNEHNRLDAFRVTRRGEVHVLPLEQVDWIGAAGNYVELHSGDTRVLARGSIGEIENRLDPGRFLRIHRSFIVNLERARHLERGPGGWRLQLDNDHRLAVSRRRLRDVQAALGAP